jgi:hypothetical protein
MRRRTPAHPRPRLREGRMGDPSPFRHTGERHMKTGEILPDSALEECFARRGPSREGLETLSGPLSGFPSRRRVKYAYEYSRRRKAKEDAAPRPQVQHADPRRRPVGARAQGDGLSPMPSKPRFGPTGKGSLTHKQPLRIACAPDQGRTIQISPTREEPGTAMVRRRVPKGEYTKTAPVSKRA